MTLLQLNAIAASYIAEDPENANAPVLVTTMDGGVGGRSAVAIIDANMGFDWENGQFRLSTQPGVVKKVD